MRKQSRNENVRHRYFAPGTCSVYFSARQERDQYKPTDSLVNAGGTNIDSANEVGSRLIAANDCFTCHRIEEKNIGPSYRLIAERYTLNEGNVENLAHKIIAGGKGLWGDVAMTPHANLSEPDAREMARYVYR